MTLYKVTLGHGVPDAFVAADNPAEATNKYMSYLASRDLYHFSLRTLRAITVVAAWDDDGSGRTTGIPLFIH